MNDLMNKVIKVMRQYLDEMTNDIEPLTDDEIFEIVYDTMADRKDDIELSIYEKAYEARAVHIELIVDDFLEELIDDWVNETPWDM